jgi:hypothetical protein
MQSLLANSIIELEAALAAFGDDHLFRGQTRAYWDDDGAPHLNSSFTRKGCMPPLMLKWSFFVRDLLRRGGFDVSRPGELNFNQGLLQHYGWRSFFVDLSASSAVGAWFASHVFDFAYGWNFCENSFEEPVMLRVQRARYTQAEGMTNLYVLSKERLRLAGHALLDLDGELTTDCPTRYHAQRAWLAGIFAGQHRIDPHAVVAHITAPADVFSEFAAAGGLKSTDDVFPGPAHDKFLEQLLSLPFQKLSAPDAPFPLYVRSLDIPEYQDSFVKHLPPETILADPVWASDLISSGRDTGLWVRVPEETFYGVTPTDVEMPRIAPYLRSNSLLQLETRGLICFPVVEGNSAYDKGISIRRDGAGNYEVGSLSVDYYSDRVKGVGVSKGYRYKLDGDRLTRIPSDDDCPCGDPERHRYHLRALAVLDDMLRNANTHQQGHIVTLRI